VIDLGDDQYTAGRPHPMMIRGARGADRAGCGGSAVGVVLLDVVLGHGAPRPAGAVALPYRSPSRADRSMAFVA
jgi:FdrA protein